MIYDRAKTVTGICSQHVAQCACYWVVHRLSADVAVWCS